MEPWHDSDDELHGLDFQQILAQPTLAYDEGFRFFRGVGLMNLALRRLARDLDGRGIPYSVIGAVAMNLHGFKRMTTCIDLVLTRYGVRAFTTDFVGCGYRPASGGAARRFTTNDENVPIKFYIAGEYPGDGKPKPVVFPDPVDSSVEIKGVKTIRLEKLVELKLASGMTGQGRRKDLSDVQELIRALSLDAAFAERIDPSVREMYRTLYDELELGRDQTDAPDRDG